MNHRHPLHRLELYQARPTLTAGEKIGEALTALAVVLVLPVVLCALGALV